MSQELSSMQQKISALTACLDAQYMPLHSHPMPWAESEVDIFMSYTPSSMSPGDFRLGASQPLSATLAFQPLEVVSLLLHPSNLALALASLDEAFRPGPHSQGKTHLKALHVHGLACQPLAQPCLYSLAWGHSSGQRGPALVPGSDWGVNKPKRIPRDRVEPINRRQAPLFPPTSSTSLLLQPCTLEGDKALWKVQAQWGMAVQAVSHGLVKLEALMDEATKQVETDPSQCAMSWVSSKRTSLHGWQSLCSYTPTGRG